MGTFFVAPAQLSTIGTVAVVELHPDARGTRLPFDSAVFGGVPAYQAFSELAKAAFHDNLGEESLRACETLTEQVGKDVAWFCTRFTGLLDWGTKHDCLGGKNTGHAFHQYLWAARPPRYANSVTWLLRESLTLRRAVKTAAILKQVREGGPIQKLTELTWLEGMSGRSRWERKYRSAFRYLDETLNEHLRLVSPVNVPILQTFRRGNRPIRTRWLREGIDFGRSPLGGLWWSFYRDLLTGVRESRVCAGCGSLFTPKRRDQTYCTPECGHRTRMREYRTARAEEGNRGAVSGA